MKEIDQIQEMINIMDSYFRRRNIKTIIAVVLGFIVGYNLFH